MRRDFKTPTYENKIWNCSEVESKVTIRGRDYYETYENIGILQIKQTSSGKKSSLQTNKIAQPNFSLCPLISAYLLITLPQAVSISKRDGVYSHDRHAYRYFSSEFKQDKIERQLRHT